jgi:glucan phosphoethanolaminetransferase (alkaline phosphatase superfamily)
MSAFKKAFSNRPFVGALLFVFLLCIFEELIFDFPQVRWLLHIIKYFDHGDVWITFVSSIASFVICCLFVEAALGSSRIFQVLYTILFALSLVLQYGYQKAVERFIIPVDLRIAIATPIDTWKGASILFFDWRVLLPVIVFILGLFIFSERQGLKTSFKKLRSIFFLIVILNFSYGLKPSPLNLGLSFSSLFQTTTRFLIDDTLPPKREVLSGSHTHAPKNNIVLVIDESVRFDHLSINGYVRETTPFLDWFAGREDGFHNFGLAVSGATCSFASNSLLLTGVRPGFDDFQKTSSYPTLFQYAKAMGYKTYYMDAQTNSFWNGLTDHDAAFIDSWFKAIDLGDDFESDFRAADMIVKIVSNSSGNFIVLNKRGVHFLYENSYPPEAAVWQPLPGDYAANRQGEAAVWLPLPVDYAANRHLISNTYDNGVLYNVNTFFERLLINPEMLENTVILYTSDHGETLFENHVNWPHCNYTPQEAMVPLILIGKNLPPINDSYHASHSNILPTLLDLMGVPSDQRMHLYAPSLLSETMDLANGRFYFDGSLNPVHFPDSYLEASPFMND